MKQYIVRLSVFTILLFGAKPAATLADSVYWHVGQAVAEGGTQTGTEALEAAKAEARASGKYVFFVVGNYNCSGCTRLTDEYCEDPVIRALLDPYYVCCYIYAYDDDNWPLALSYYNEIDPNSNFPWAWIVDPNETSPSPLAAAGDFYGTAILEALLNDNKPTLPTYSNWIGGFGLPVEEQGYDDDPAEDGVQNLLKYACDLAPTNYCASTNLMQDVVSNGTFGVVYFKSKTAIGVQLDPVWVASLTNTGWTAAGVSTEQLGDEDGREKWKATLPSAGEQGFMRLQAVQE
jgi:hypothetical protein